MLLLQEKRRQLVWDNKEEYFDNTFNLGLILKQNKTKKKVNTKKSRKIKSADLITSNFTMKKVRRLQNMHSLLYITVAYLKITRSTRSVIKTMQYTFVPHCDQITND